MTNEFSGRFSSLMKETRTKQKDIAEICGVTRQSVSLWSKGDTIPDIVSLSAISEHFGVSSDYLIGLSNTKENRVTAQTVGEFLGISEETVLILKELGRKYK